MTSDLQKIVQLLALLHERDVRLWLEGGELRYRGSADVLTPDLMGQLRQHKPAIIEFLASPKQTSKNPPPLHRLARPAQLPLSFAQERLWFLDQMEPGVAQYNMPQGLRLIGWLDVGALQESLGQIVRRHEVLRTCYEMKDGQPVQVIGPSVPLALPCQDLSGLAAAGREAELKRLCAEEGRRPFDLAHGPVLRARLFRLGETEHLLFLNMHHIASDGWSMGVLMRELAALYQALRAGQPPPLPGLPVQYGDYAVWQRGWLQGEVLEQQLGYWRKQLAGMPERLELPADRPRPAARSYRGALQELGLPPSLAVAVAELGRQEGVSLFMTLLAAFQALLHRYTGVEDVVVGSPIAGRNRAELEGLIGFFVNTLVLRGDLAGDPSFRTLLQRTRAMALGAYDHQDVPFEMLVKELQPKRDMGHTPLFQVMFVLQNAPMETPRLAGLETSMVLFDSGTAKFDLTLFVWESGGGLQVVVEYDTDLFETKTSQRLLGHYQTLLGGIVSNPNQRLSELPLLTAAERHQLLVGWNQTAVEYPRDKCIHQLFAEQAGKSPGAVALAYGDQQLTYRELNERANQLAHHLQKLGVGPDTLVGLFMDRSLELVVGILGILKAGGAYVPLDPAYPKERLAFMLADSALKIVVTNQPLSEDLDLRGIVQLDLAAEGRLIQACPKQNLECINLAEHPAYVIYTSGSTGQPKGIVVPHRGVVRLVRGQHYAEFDNRQRILLLASTSFDATTFELWGPLLNGAMCVVFPKQLLGFEQLETVIRLREVTCLWLTAGLFNQIIDTRPSALETVQYVITGGEALSVVHVKKAMKLLPRLCLTNGYGPTESTTFACCHAIKPGELFSNGSVPIGRPISNTEVYILDTRLQPVPIGVVGELHIGGDGLARGYFNRPELTAEKFIANPFSDGPGSRLYKTGDICRYRADGSIEFFGRLDQQVKIRGFRIEPGEIEAVLGSHPDIRECVVVARENVAGEKRLVAYLVAREGMTPVPDLREFLLKKLPGYMVPAAFVNLENLPLTPNGKVNRKSLPEPDSNTPLSNNYAIPGNYSEQVLHGIWREVLNLKRVGIRDNFFDLGGHSLLAVRFIGEINKRLKVNLHIPAFFKNPTIEQLAKILDAGHLLQPGSQLMPLQPGESAGSLFLLDAGIGLCRLAEQFNTGPASFATIVPLSSKAFRSASLGNLSDLPSVEELAALHMELIRNHLRPGPCMLAGHSFGGLLAFEVAHQLQREGRQVEMVFLLDSWVGSIPWWRKLRNLTLNRAKKSLAFRTSRIWNKANARMARARKRPEELLGSSSSVANDVNVPFGAAPWEVLSKVYRNAQKNYRLRPLASQAVLFRAQDSEFKHLFAIDGNLGWDGLFEGGLKVVESPGDHFTLLKTPNLELLVEHFKQSAESLKPATKS